MEVIFLNAAGTTLFTRSDMESGHWVHQEMNVTADFPFVKEKKIERGMRIAFRDSLNVIQVFEIRAVTNREPGHFQSIMAEHICISELSDEHINKKELDGKTAQEALTLALTGTLWSVGTNTASGTQNADFSRGSVWDAVAVIQKNWNVYITPRVVISAAGAITGRYLDIQPAGGTWRGVRLSVHKNLDDPAVLYNDEDVLTALYGYGADVGKSHATGDDTIEELTFADEVWTATSEHPAKPANQIYLEWPEKTALYGRNGRPRYGYYQNGGIKDAAVLLQKTWEALQQTCNPKISISGTVVDLYRMGYKDEPLRLHDLAIVEIEETGETFQKEIICLDEDLVDPSNTRPDIGDYIPNIIYINHEKSGGGGGGGRGQTNEEDEDERLYTQFFNLQNKAGMIVGTKNGVDYIKADQISLAINESTGDTTALIRADHIVMEGDTSIEALLSGTAQIEVLDVADLYAGQLVVSGEMAAGVGKFETSIDVGEYTATWQSKTITEYTLSASRYFMRADSNGSTTPVGTVTGKLVTNTSETTIHYLGSAS